MANRFLTYTGLMFVSYCPVPLEWFRSILMKDSDKRNDSHGWDYMSNIFESHRYSVVVGWADLLLPSTRRVLDVGCGEGILAERLKYGTYFGIDVSAPPIEKAKSKGLSNATFLCQSMPDFLAHSQGQAVPQYDLIIFNESLYYIKDPIHVFSETLRFLAPDGVVIVSMFETYLARRIWRAIASKGVQEIVYLKTINSFGFPSQIRAFVRPGSKIVRELPIPA